MLYIVLTVGVGAFWVLLVYNSLIAKRNKVKEAFASIDVQLKRRYDQIPNMVDIMKDYMKYEKDILAEITLLRDKYSSLSSSTYDMNKKIIISKESSYRMNNIIARAENYPDLKANESFIILMKTYNEIEEHISAARRFYNSAVNELKNAVEMFPLSVVASMFNIKSQEFFSIEQIERMPINIGL